MFITFEGGEGAGKSTQVKKIEEWLLKCGKPVVVTREPGGTEFAEKIRALIVNEDDKDIKNPHIDLLLLLSARIHHIENIITPALKKGKWVLCDRFSDSTMVYQGIASQLGVNTIKNIISSIEPLDIEPDCTFYMDTSPEIGLQRTRTRNSGEDRFENMNIDFHYRIRQGFLDLQKDTPRMYLIDAEKKSEDVFSAIKSILQRFI